MERFDAFRDAVCDLLERWEQDTSRLPVARHALINGVRQQATAAEIGGKLAHVVADRLHITRADASRRIEEAEDLGQRGQLIGPILGAQLGELGLRALAGVGDRSSTARRAKTPGSPARGRRRGCRRAGRPR